MGASGIDGQLGFAAESTYNTPVTVDRFFEFLSEKIVFSQERIESKGIRSGRRISRRFAPGKQKVEGSVEMELAPGGMALLFEHAIGDRVTTGTGPYTHTFTPGSRDGKSLTAQAGRPSTDGTINPFTYSGVKIASWSLKAAIDEYIMATFNLYGAAEEIDPGVIPLVTAPVYSDDDNPFVYTDAAFTLDGQVLCPMEWELTFTTALKTERHFMCPASGAVPAEALENGEIEITGTFSGDFEDLDNYSIYRNNQIVPLTAAFTNADGESLTIDLMVRLDGDTSTVEGQELLKENISFMALSNIGDADAFTLTLVNNDSEA